MTDRVLIDGDDVKFLCQFGAAKVFVRLIKIRGSGKALVNGKKVCLKGDEVTVSLGCFYETPTHRYIKGFGTVEIKALKGGHISKILVVDGKQVLLKGENFDAVFSVKSPALAPPPSLASDTTLKYEGEGEFVIKGERKWQSN